MTKYVDAEWLNGDPCWVIYELPNTGLWKTARDPYEIEGCILHGNGEYPDAFSVTAGYSPMEDNATFIYDGRRFVFRNNLYKTQEEARAECRRRNFADHDPRDGAA